MLFLINFVSITSLPLSQKKKKKKNLHLYLKYATQLIYLSFLKSCNTIIHNHAIKLVLLVYYAYLFLFRILLVAEPLDDQAPSKIIIIIFFENILNNLIIFK